MKIVRPGCEFNPFLGLGGGKAVPYPRAWLAKP